MARGSAGGPNGGNCVAFARQATGIHLDGNAAAWWPHAEGHYDRGHQPSAGAILVFKAHGRMHVGHVAVVSHIVGPREVLVDQANWVRGRVTRAMSVIDASPLNDWTSVKVLEPHSGKHGRENPTFGFIYPGVLPASFGETIIEPERIDRHRKEHVTRAAGAGETVIEPQKPDARHKDRAVRTVDRAAPELGKDKKEAKAADPGKVHRLTAKAADRHAPKPEIARFAAIY